MKLLASILQVAGLVVVAVGVALFSLPAGLIVAGAALVLVGFAFGMSK